MPRKPKPQKHTTTVLVNYQPITVTLHPPTGTRKSWYAYWQGLVSSKSTGQTDLQDAIRAVEGMLRNDGQRPSMDDAMMTDEEFVQIQRRHFAKKTSPAAMARAAKTLTGTLEAISAFKAISGLGRIASATPDHCEKFQTEALKKPINWRGQRAGGDTLPTTATAAPKRRPSKTQKRRALAGSQDATEKTISPNTVLKWTRTLQAAFQRANLNGGKKCVRGVVPEGKLLNSNPWMQFTWVEGIDRPIRQFDPQELAGLMTYLDGEWSAVPVAALAVKVLLWSCCRKLEVAGLRWDSLRLIGPADDPTEVHFEIVGKWGIERWFRISNSLYRDLLAQRREGSPFVFAAYTDQIRRQYADNPGCLKKIRDDFTDKNFGRWVYERVKDWSATQPKGSAYLHVFRKTGLQCAHDGEETASRKVADDAGVSERVLLGHYVKPKLWRKSNRTYNRLIASLPADVARQYGYVEDEKSRLERELGCATEAGNWSLVAELAARLKQMDLKDRPQAG